MRRFLTILFLFFYFFGVAQTFPTNQWFGSATTLTEMRGAVKAGVGIILTRYADTATANLNPYIKNYAGAEIVIGDTIWFRNSTASKWLKASGAAGSGGGGNTLYSADDDLASNRIVGLNGKTLDFTEGGNVFLTLNPTVGNESIGLNARNITDGGNFSGITGITTNVNSQFDLKASFDGGSAVALITASAAAGNSELNIQADSITINGVITLQQLSGFGSGIVAVDNNGLLSWSAGGGTSGIDDVLAVGQALSGNKSIPTSAFQLAITSSNADKTFSATNTNSGVAVQGVSATGYGLFGSTTSGYGIGASATSGVAAFLNVSPTSTNTEVKVLNILRSTSGTAANGIGGSIDFLTQSTDGSYPISNRLISKFTNATTATITSQFDITGVNSAATEIFANFQTGGIVKVNNLADTLATKAYVRSVGGGGNTIYTGDGTLAGPRAIALDGNTLNINQGANSFLSINPTAGAETIVLQAYNTTGNDNSSFFSTSTTNTNASFNIVANFNSGVKSVDITALTNTTTSSIDITADSIRFIHNNFITDTSVNYVQTINKSTGTIGKAFFPVGSGNTIYTGDGAIDDATRTVTMAGNNVLFTTTTGTFRVSNGSENLLDINPLGNEATILGFDGTAFARMHVQGGAGASTFDIIASQGEGSGFAVNILGNAVDGLIEYHTWGEHEFMGNVRPLADSLYDLGIIPSPWDTLYVNTVRINTSLISNADNTDDIGSASVAFKDIYGRTLKLDGSTSGTITIAADALANIAVGTNLSGTGTIPFFFDIYVRSDETLSASNVDQPLFTNAAHDVIAVLANTTYRFSVSFDLTHGAVSHSLSFGLVPTTATVTNIVYDALVWPTAVGTTTASQNTTRVKATATTAINSAAANGTETVVICGWITIGATGGTLLPTIKFSADPTGTVLLKTGAEFHIWAVGNDTFTEKGPFQ